MEKYKELRKKYPAFLYQGYQFKFKKPHFRICYYFKIEPDLEFQTQISIKKVNQLKNISQGVLDNLIFHLGLVEMLNYWKLTCSPIIDIEAGILNKEQIRFLRKIIFKGMGQYFYENKIDFTQKNFLKIKVKTAPIHKNEGQGRDSPSILVPVGGGKDSIVVLEILRGGGRKLGSFILNPQEPQLKIIKIARLKENIFVERKLDPLLFKLNKAGFLNGHVPFSAFLAFLSLILAYLFDYQKIAFAWEKSSSYPNLKYKGRWINHQWSKSLEFERSFSQYTKKYLLKNVEVFSPIRNFSELEIAEIFSKLEKYHSVFVSCNKAYKVEAMERKWCGKCAKCLFTFLILYPFFEEKKLIKIFGKNLLEDKKLLLLMKQLTGEEKFKPFECVGTEKESLRAVRLAQQKIKIEKRSMPYLLRYFMKNEN